MPDDATTTETDLPAGQPVPYERFTQVNGRAKAAEARIAELEPLARKATDGEAAVARFSRYQESAQRGIVDPSIFEAVEGAWGKLPEQGRPTLGAYLDQLRADPSKAPALLRPHLSSATTSAAAAQTAAAGGTSTSTAAGTTAARTAQPATPAGTQAPGAPAALSVEAIRAAREEGVRTGNWSRWIEMRKNLG
jgi:hypothetical protein